jgi:hypothetical protein
VLVRGMSMPCFVLGIFLCLSQSSPAISFSVSRSPAPIV